MILKFKWTLIMLRQVNLRSQFQNIVFERWIFALRKASEHFDVYHATLRQTLNFAPTVTSESPLSRLAVLGVRKVVKFDLLYSITITWISMQRKCSKIIKNLQQITSVLSQIEKVQYMTLYWPYPAKVTSLCLSLIVTKMFYKFCWKVYDSWGKS